MATAMIEMVAVCLKIFRRLFGLVNPESPKVMANSRNTAIKPI
jgi:hypothetical protein